MRLSKLCVGITANADGPFENWPTGLGFEYFYGFLGGEASQYEPNLVRNTTTVAPPKTVEEGIPRSGPSATITTRCVDLLLVSSCRARRSKASFVREHDLVIRPRVQLCSNLFRLF
jgi:hypothetical protein